MLDEKEQLRFLDEFLQLLKRNFNHKALSFPSLMDNYLSGALLFSSIYRRNSNTSENDKFIHTILRKILINLNEVKHISLCDGLIGTGWLLSSLKAQNLIDIKDDGFFNQLDEIAYSFSLNCLRNGNYDYMYGALGGIFYLLDRIHVNHNKSKVDALMTSLRKISIKGPVGVTWKDSINSTKSNTEFNLGLAHGQGSLIVLFSKIYMITGNPTAQETLRRSIEFLFNNGNQDTRSFFPPFKKNNSENKNARLAWCYGDLGLSCALFQAGSALGDQALIQKSITVCDRTTLLLEPSDTRIKDFGLCHGSSGAAQIYNRMFAYSKENVFKNASNYWINKTYTDFYPLNLAPGNEYENYGLLEGLSGVALATLSNYYNDNSWDKFLLLS